jgi:hypothetical protein
MFEYLPEVCLELHAQILQIYWILIIPFCVLLIVFEFFKMPEGNPNAGDILRRTVISMILLFTFNETMNLMAMVGDGVTDKINGVKSLWELMGELGKNYDDSSVSWLKFREAIIFVLSLVSYIVAYLGVFVANVLIHFVWSVLYVCSPIMILMYISRSTAFVTSNLYKGMINVMVWKVLWSILAIMLLKLATAPQVGSWDNFLTSILINLCIGVSMLFIPFATKSLINDGMSGAASALAAVPTAATGAFIKTMAIKNGKNLLNQGSKGLKSTLTKVGRPISQNMQMAKERIDNRIQNWRNANKPNDPPNLLRPNFNKGRNNNDKK